MQREGGVSALQSLVDLNEAISCNFQVASVVRGGHDDDQGLLFIAGQHGFAAQMEDRTSIRGNSELNLQGTLTTPDFMLHMMHDQSAH